MEGGWHAPSECGIFWNQSIPRDLHYTSSQDLNDKQKDALLTPLSAIMGKRENPIAIKNLRITERLPLILDLFPNARFIILKRDRLETGRSILKERKKFGIPQEDWWSARPVEFPEIRELPLEQRVAGQIHYLEEQIDRELKGVPEERKRTLHYRSIVQDPSKTVQDLKRNLLKEVQFREGGIIPEPRKVENKDEDQEEKEALRDAFLKLGLPYE